MHIVSKGTHVKVDYTFDSCSNRDENPDIMASKYACNSRDFELITRLNPHNEPVNPSPVTPCTSRNKSPTQKNCSILETRRNGNAFILETSVAEMNVLTQELFIGSQKDQNFNP